RHTSRQRQGRTALRRPALPFGNGLAGGLALLRGAQADHVGNVVYRCGARNFNPIFATAATTTIVEVDSIVDTGSIDPEMVVTPGIFVDRIVQNDTPLDKEAVLNLSRQYGKQVRLEGRQPANGPHGLPPELMACKAARLLRPGEYANLGL